MRKWLVVIAPLTMIFVLSGFGFRSLIVRVPEPLKVTEPTLVLFPLDSSATNRLDIVPPYLGNHFIGFREALAFKESQGNYFTINDFGYLGKYQFGIETLELMGISSENQFLSDPKLQEEIFKINIARNKWILRRDIKKYVGQDFGGVEITESGIVAAAHLAGAGNVKRYLRTFGEIDVSDGFGTSISKYLKKFAGYDISMIPAERNPRIQF
jgi:hypothetical protein